MTGPEHYREAERHLSAASYTTGPNGVPISLPTSTFHLGMAQVHATLALAAVQAAQLADRYIGDGDHINDWRATTSNVPHITAETTE
ncbi:MAG: hypothetical protein K0R62_3794 [Nonomuraea muscovyensis]|nr:hypothetical protein [Nonomuraea muscovyensis]